MDRDSDFSGLTTIAPNQLNEIDSRKQPVIVRGSKEGQPVSMNTISIDPNGADGSDASKINMSVSSALAYMESIIDMLREPRGLETLHAELTRMNVKGTLFAPLLELEEGGARRDLERTEWVEDWHGGGLDIRSCILARSLAGDQNITILQLTAAFRVTADGPVLERLDLERKN